MSKEEILLLEAEYTKPAWRFEHNPITSRSHVEMSVSHDTTTQVIRFWYPTADADKMLGKQEVRLRLVNDRFTAIDPLHDDRWYDISNP